MIYSNLWECTKWTGERWTISPSYTTGKECGTKGIKKISKCNEKCLMGKTDNRENELQVKPTELHKRGITKLNTQPKWRYIEN